MKVTLQTLKQLVIEAEWLYTRHTFSAHDKEQYRHIQYLLERMNYRVAQREVKRNT